LKLLLSVHDVTPFHLARLVRAEQFLTSLGVTRATFLLVPDFHGRWAVHEHEGFLTWCRGTHPLEIEWVLHGHFHSEAIEPAGGPRPRGVRPWFDATFMTDGEGEFQRLRGAALRARLQRGVQAFERCVATRPRGFVAPAWLFNEDLEPALKDLGFEFTEDHGSVYDVQAGRRRRCPVITWATRTRLREYGARVVCPVQARLWTALPAIRIALHPMDFDHPGTVVSIERVLRHARRRREITSYGGLLGLA
jgi:predicted deacetylase